MNDLHNNLGLVEKRETFAGHKVKWYLHCLDWSLFLAQIPETCFPEISAQPAVHVGKGNKSVAIATPHIV